MRWLGPLSAAALVALLLSPELIQHDRKPDPAASPPVMRAQPSAPQGAPAVEVASLEPTAPAPPATLTPIDTLEVDLDLSSHFDCVIEPAEVVELGSPVTGVIQTIHVERAATELARARSQLQGAIKSREASHALGQRRQARIDRLFKGETLSLDLRDQAETEAKIAELDLYEAKEHRRLATLEFHQALALLQRRTIRSPISGVVVSREMSGGEVVVDEKTILTIAQIDPLRVEVILPSALYGGVQQGMRAAVEPEFGDQVHIASVKIVDRVIDAASGTFGVQLELPNPDHAIPGGLHCQVRFLGP
jgi:multidrug efflux pump subunit AcrA (membrane-fusion protein)